MDLRSARAASAAEARAKPGPPIFVANLKAGGSVHRIAPGSHQVPRPQRRTHCGWHYGKGGTLVNTFTRLGGSGRRCRRCFAEPDAEHDRKMPLDSESESISEFG